MTLENRKKAIQKLIDESMRHCKEKDFGSPALALEAASLAILDGHSDPAIVDYAVHAIIGELEHKKYERDKREVLSYALKTALWGASNHAVNELLGKCIELGFADLASEAAKLQRRFLSAEEIDALTDVYIANGIDCQGAVSLTEMPNISAKTIQKLISALEKEYEKYPNERTPHYISTLKNRLHQDYSIDRWVGVNWPIAIKTARQQGQFFSLDFIQKAIESEKENPM